MSFINTKLNDDDLKSSPSHEGGDIINLNVRFLNANDKFRKKRSIWINGLFIKLKERSFGYCESYFFSSCRDSYDVVIFGGNDIPRIRRIFVENYYLINQKIKICLVSNSTPYDRAELLMFGFDDVFDILRMDTEEARARIISIYRRFRYNYEISKIGKIKKLIIYKICGESRINNRQEMAITALYKKNKQVVSYQTLRQILSQDHNDISMGALKVFICDIRKKLRPGVNIKAINSIGYMLDYN